MVGLAQFVTSNHFSLQTKTTALQSSPQITELYCLEFVPMPDGLPWVTGR